jgi:hypothetical protein
MLSNIEVPVSVDKTEELMHYFTKIDRI